jgi:hypothetical protein
MNMVAKWWSIRHENPLTVLLAWKGLALTNATLSSNTLKQARQSADKKHPTQIKVSLTINPFGKLMRLVPNVTHVLTKIINNFIIEQKHQWPVL